MDSFENADAVFGDVFGVENRQKYTETVSAAFLGRLSKRISKPVP